MRVNGYSFAEVAEAFGLTEEEVRNGVTPKCFTRVRKYISADTPEQLERYTSLLYSMKVEFRCLPYSESYTNSFSTMERVDIVMNYHEIDEDDILKGLGLKKEDLYLYFDHS